VSNQVGNVDTSVPNATKKASKANAVDETELWLKYSPPSKQYSIRLADGWKIVSYNNGVTLYGFDREHIKYQAGVSATVTPDEGGRDWAVLGFGLVYNPDTSDYRPMAISQGKQSGQFKTNQGLLVTKFEYTNTQPVEGPELPEGATTYIYRTTNDSETVYIEHDRAKDDSSQLELIEKVVKTLEL
jgi:hypothetical protein